jgi:putative aminopeptidase FrvX
MVLSCFKYLGIIAIYRVIFREFLKIVEEIMKEFQLINELMNIHAPSGHEQEMIATMQKKFSDLGIATQTDVLGNCIAKISGSSDVDIMIFAHMDSLGLLVKKIEEDGLIRFERLGGIPEKVLPATKISIRSRKGNEIVGYIMVKAHHATSPEEKYKVDSYNDLFIDIGATSRQEVLDLGIYIGAPIVYKPECHRLQGDRIFGTFADNRRGCAALILIAEKLLNEKIKPNVYFVGSVQEEFSIRGATTAANRIKPDIGICIDGAMAHDAPGLSNKGSVKMGGGPVISMYNFHGRGTLNGTIPHPKLVEQMESTAHNHNIPIQHSVMMGALTDMSYVQYTNTGVAAIDIGIPSRNGHTPVEVCDLNDLKNTVELLSKFVIDFDVDTTYNR